MAGNVAADRNAELALVGAALIDPVVLDEVNIDPEQLAGADMRRVWRAMLELRLEGTAIDELLVAERAQVPLALIGEAAAATPTSKNADHYADIVRRHALTRAVLRAVADVSEMHGMGRVDGAELLDAALSALGRIEMGLPQSSIGIDDVIRGRLLELDQMAQARQRGEVYRTGLPTGIERLDELIAGIPTGLVTILCGRPGMGKSSLALTITSAVTARGDGAHVFSLEDLRSAYADRLISQASTVPAERIRAGEMNALELQRLGQSMRELKARKHWRYEDVSAVSAEDVVRAVRRERHRHKTKLVVVDYLQLLIPPKNCQSRHEELRKSLEVLARAAKSDGVAYLVLSQLSRELEKRKDKRPVLSDLRESGAIEERAKLVLGMYRGAYYGDPQPDIDYDNDSESRPRPEDWEKRVDVMVLKNSNGRAPLQVRLKWDGPTTRVH